MVEEEKVIDLNQLLQETRNLKFGSLSDIRSILEEYINKAKIDRISRVKSGELDRITNLLVQSHYISVLWNKALQKEGKLKSGEVVLCFAEEYVLQNLSLRLSLDSQSRTEIKEILISLIRKEIDSSLRERDAEVRLQAGVL